MKSVAVIVTHNRIDLLKECLDCVNSQEIPFSRIIVVDNHSSDGTKEYLDKIGDPRYIVIHSEKNLGGAGGFSLGLQEAQKDDYDWILILDDDAMISPDYMKILIEAGEKHKDVPALCGSVYAQGEIDLTHRRRVGNKLIFSEQSVDAKEYQKDEFYCDTVTFCGLLMRGSAFRKYGIPIKEYFIWCDDTEYCLRMYKNGERMLTVPKAVLNHRTTRSENKGNILMRIEWKSYYGYRNRYDATKRHIGGLTPSVIRLEYKIFYLASMIMKLSPNEEKRKQGEFNCSLLKDVLKDTKSGYLGVREKYLWK